MKVLHILISTFLLSFSFQSQIFAQNFEFKIVKYKQEYLECKLEYDKLKRVIGMGKKVPDTYYLNDKLFSGTAKADYPNSKMYYVYYIKNGYIEKQMIYFYNGLTSADFNFMNGQSHGYHYMYYDSGQKYIEDFYQNGVLHGYQRRWYGNGQIAREVYRKNGTIVYEHLFDKTGKRTN